jgi:hypothetical protein
LGHGITLGRLDGLVPPDQFIEPSRLSLAARIYAAFCVATFESQDLLLFAGGYPAASKA